MTEKKERKVLQPEDFIRRIEEGKRLCDEGKVTKTFTFGGLEITLALPSHRKLAKELGIARTGLLFSNAGFIKKMTFARKESETIEIYNQFIGENVERAITIEEAEANIYSIYVRDFRDPEISDDRPLISVRAFQGMYVGEYDDLPPDSAVLVNREVIRMLLRSLPGLLGFVRDALDNASEFYTKNKEAELGNSGKPQSGVQEVTSPAASAETGDSSNSSTARSGSSKGKKRKKSSKKT